MARGWVAFACTHMCAHVQPILASITGPISLIISVGHPCAPTPFGLITGNANRARPRRRPIPDWRLRPGRILARGLIRSLFFAAPPRRRSRCCASSPSAPGSIENPTRLLRRHCVHTGSAHSQTRHWAKARRGIAQSSPFLATIANSGACSLLPPSWLCPICSTM